LHRAMDAPARNYSRRSEQRIQAVNFSRPALAVSIHDTLAAANTVQP